MLSIQPTGWAGNVWINGALLIEAERAGHYDAFVTTDGAMPDEQDLSGWRFAVVVIAANRWPLIEPLARSGHTRHVVENTPQGTFCVVDIPNN